MHPEKRKFSLGIWGLGFGFFVFYTPYSALTKAISNGLLSADKKLVYGTELLPVSVMATVVMMFGIITVARWWKYAGRREFFGLSIPFPNRWTFLSGLCIATIIGTTTLAFSFSGMSIVLVLVLLRGGTLIIGPIVDLSLRRRVRWFSWTAMVVSLLALFVALADVSNYKLSLFAILNIVAYVMAYFFRLRIMTRLAKTDDKRITLGYFVEEQIVATPMLLVALATLATIGTGEILMGFRHGFTTFLSSDVVVPALLVGVFYAALCVCTTLIFLDRRENTFCVPMHCGSSMLSGLVASWALTILYHQASPSAAQLASAGLITVALLFLSPLHHLGFYLRKLNRALAGAFRWSRPSLNDQVRGEVLSSILEPSSKDTSILRPSLRRVFLFVCSGNTSRSPMAQAICSQEMARRLRVSVDELSSHNVSVISAGLAARPGSPMKRHAQLALERLRVSSNHHASQSLTPQMVERAEKIFCMTESQRQRVIEDFSGPPDKVQLLDPRGDIEEPREPDSEAFVNCASRIWTLISKRLDESGINGPVLVEGTTGG
ncbi:MAG: hypothetical protein WAU45_08010 [Blastocatellia bacterium]